MGGGERILNKEGRRVSKGNQGKGKKGKGKGEIVEAERHWSR